MKCRILQIDKKSRPSFRFFAFRRFPTVPTIVLTVFNRWGYAKHAHLRRIRSSMYFIAHTVLYTFVNSGGLIWNRLPIKQNNTSIAAAHAFLSYTYIYYDVVWKFSRYTFERAFQRELKVTKSATAASTTTMTRTLKITFERYLLISRTCTIRRRDA